MPRSTPFRLNRSGVLLALISAAFAGQAGAAAGRVEFAVGSATVVGTDGRTRAVSRGAELDTGDTVRTNEGRVQVRMTDGAFVSLQPNTEFGIKEYKFSGKTDGTESAFYSLVKGAMRTVTGLIGRVNRNRYQVATPTATVGIRGTGGLIQVLNDGSTLVQGTSGIWFLANPSGSIDIPAGVSGLAPSDPKQPPKETSDVPTAGPTPPPAFTQGEEREPDGTSVITGGVLQSGSGYAAALAHTADTCGDACISPFIDSGVGIATFNGSGQLTQMEFSGRTSAVFALQSGGSDVDSGTDGILAWGRWIGPVTNPASLVGTEFYGPDQGLHYVIGMPTATLPTTGSANYVLLGATSPTYLDGSASPGSFSGSMTVNFVAGTALITAGFGVAMTDGRNYSITGSGCTSSSMFSLGTSTTGSGGACLCSCSSNVQGFFAGASAERAGLAYKISDSGTISKEVIGAAAFQQQ